MSIEQAITNSTSLQDNEYHVASFVVQAMENQVLKVKSFIETIDGAEVHGISPEGKIVFTLESNSHKSIGIKIDQLKNHDGLITLLPVYHQYQNE